MPMTDNSTIKKSPISFFKNPVTEHVPLESPDISYNLQHETFNGRTFFPSQKRRNEIMMTFPLSFIWRKE